ncbi:MAG: ATP-binding cassette domain-containing protein [Roseinatronobacter sp.]
MSLELDQIRILRGDQPMVSLDCIVPAGTVLTLMGPSGCGKSTLLAHLIGALPPVFTATGQVRVGGRDITDLAPHKRNLGILFQDAILFPHLSVAGNLGFGLPRRTPDRAARIEAALHEAGLAGMGARDPATLSGGQRARVALMRTLLAAPKALLLDEPFSKLDTDLRAQMRGLVFDLARARGLAVVLVTHDLDDARAAGGPVLDVQGRVIVV